MTDHRPDTLLVHAGRDPHAHQGFVNPPVFHASTVLWPSVAAMQAAARGVEGPPYRYGRIATPTAQAFETAVAALEGGHGAVSVSSGLAAIVLALTSVAAAGDHLLVTDSAYGPTRAFCDKILGRLGVEVEYYDPLCGAAIERLVRPNTRMIYMESPGSITFEVQDVPAITAVARRHGIVTALDNTWATPLLFKAFEHGVDISIHAATKYLVGHSDAMMGIATAATPEHWRMLKDTAVLTGQCAGPDDLFLAQRGLRTLSVRLERHAANALAVARWLTERPEVERVLCPALPDDPGHAIWKRDFRGMSGLFSVILKPFSKSALAAMLDGMRLFQIGASWGGYESLVLPMDPRPVRSATCWAATGPLIRLHVGLEDPADLIADLDAGFTRLRAAS